MIQSLPRLRQNRHEFRNVGGRWWCRAAIVIGCVLTAIDHDHHVVAADGDTFADAKPVIKDGQAQVVREFSDPEYWVRHDLWVETDSDSDGDGRGDRVHVSVTRPNQTEYGGLRVPAVYITSPYFAGTGSTDVEYMWNPRQQLGDPPPIRKRPPATTLRARRPVISKTHTRDWVPRGFAVVHSSSPGTGLSEGCPTVGGQNESLAPKAVIDWLCGRRPGYTTVDGNDAVAAHWCTGKVGMTGTSYNGTLPLAAATTGVEGLEAIIPIAPNTSYYHYYRSNGLVRHPGGYLGEDIDVLYEFIHSGNEDRREYCDCEVMKASMQSNMDRRTGDYNDFWQSRDYALQLSDVRAAVLMAHGFNDWNVVPEHSYRIIKRLKQTGVPLQIYYHQDGHGGPPPMSMRNRWFTRYLLGDQNGVENDPKAWIVREDKKQDAPTPYPDYPHPDAAAVTLVPAPGAPGRGTLKPTTSAASESSETTETLIDNYAFDAESLARAETTRHRLIYLSDTLHRPLHISGVPKIEIMMASDRPATNLSVYLVSLPWNDSRRAKITDNIITRGWADPQNRNSIRQSEPLVPGEMVKVAFELQPDDQIIAAGQQIGLMIMASDKEFTLHPDPGTQVTVDLAKTQLTLPVVGGESAYQKAMTPPAETSAEN